MSTFSVQKLRYCKKENFPNNEKYNATSIAVGLPEMLDSYTFVIPCQKTLN